MLERPQRGPRGRCSWTCTSACPEGATAKDVAQAHGADVRNQAQCRIYYLRYWVDELGGKVFCLVEAPDVDRGSVHREAPGLVADHIYQVEEGF